MKMLKTIALSGFILASLAFSSASMADHSWGKYKWKTSGDLNLELRYKVNDVWYPYLDTASLEWSDSAVLDTAVLSSFAPGGPESCNPETGNVQVCNFDYGDNGWLGLAQIYISRGRTITAGVAKLNDYYHNSAPYNTDEWRRLVMCQEVAHSFALAHQDETFENTNLGSCMDYTNDPDGTIYTQPSNEYPNEHDFEQLEIIYPPDDGGGDGGGGGGGGSCNPRSPMCNGATAAGGHAQWGQLVSRHGGTEIFERSISSGRKVVTFVTWTLEHAGNHEH
jgi:hypothetical protein